MLLAAGLGTRLRPLTDDRPKCMVAVAGVPILVRNIVWLRDHGVTDLVVNLHYHPDAVTSLIGDGTRLGVRVQYSLESDLLGTSGAVLRARTLLGDGRFVVVYADNLYKVDLARLEARHLATESAMTIALFWRADVSASGVAVVDGDGRVCRFVEKPSSVPPPSHLVNAGLYVCEPAIFGAIPTAGASDFGRDAIPHLIGAGARVQGHPLGNDEALDWIDTPNDLARTERAYAGSNP